MSELVLRFVTKNFDTFYEQNYHEKNYSSPYTIYNPNTYMGYPNRDVFSTNMEEFNYSYKINSLGFFGKEPELFQSNRLRIACFGDFFTQGIGVPIDSSWPASLDFHLSNCDLLNAGLLGSDPIYSIKFLEEIVWSSYSPDIILFALNDTDVGDVMVRGGMERFQEDGSVRYKNSPFR